MEGADQDRLTLSPIGRLYAERVAGAKGAKCDARWLTYRDQKQLVTKPDGSWVRAKHWATFPRYRTDPKAVSAYIEMLAAEWWENVGRNMRGTVTEAKDPSRRYSIHRENAR